MNVGGAARVSYIVGRERARAERVLHLDGGDCFQGAPIFNFYSGEPEIRAAERDGHRRHGRREPRVRPRRAEPRQPAPELGRLPRPRRELPVRGPVASPAPRRSARSSTRSPCSTSTGLRVGVIGMGEPVEPHLDLRPPNRLGITPLNTDETAQFYVDLLRPMVDVIVVVTPPRARRRRADDPVDDGHRRRARQPQPHRPPAAEAGAGLLAYSETASDGTVRAATSCSTGRDSAARPGSAASTTPTAGTDGHLLRRRDGHPGGRRDLQDQALLQPARRRPRPLGRLREVRRPARPLFSNDPADLPRRRTTPRTGFEVLSRRLPALPDHRADARGSRRRLRPRAVPAGPRRARRTSSSSSATRSTARSASRRAAATRRSATSSRPRCGCASASRPTSR